MLLIAFALACTQPKPARTGDSATGGDDTDTTGETGSETGTETGDPGDDTGASGDDTGDPPDPDPWDAEGYWTEPGPFQPLLDLDLVPDAIHWEVWMTTSADGHDWDPDARLVAHTFSSLDLFIYKDQGLILGGSVAFNPDLGVEAPFGNLFALTTDDLETWGSHMWAIDNTEYELITDPGLHVLPDGSVRAAYFAAGKEWGAWPPEDIPGDHEVKVALRDGETFVEQDEHVYAIENLVDPVMCVWDESHVFATGGATVVHATGDDAGAMHTTDERFHWGNAQVPFCFKRDGVETVISQAGGGFGPPVYRTLQEDGEWTEPEEFFAGEDPFDGGCTSPVLGEFQGQWVMFCAVWWTPE